MQMTWEQTVQGWDSETRELAEMCVQRYGPPDEMGDRRLTWYERGPWYHISVYRDKIPHKFPNEHSDFFESAIRYQVPPERFDDLARFDGSVWVERTKGVLHARCDKEGLNMLAMNLALTHAGIEVDRLSGCAGRPDHSSAPVSHASSRSYFQTDTCQSR